MYLGFGPSLLVTWSAIFGGHFSPWDALISQKCGNGRGLCPFGPFLGPKWPFLMVSFWPFASSNMVSYPWASLWTLGCAYVRKKSEMVAVFVL